MTEDRLDGSAEDAVAVDRWTVAEAVPDVLVAFPTPRTAAEERARRDLGERTRVAGAVLGFEVGTAGAWRSTSGVTIVTRLGERPVTPAAAVHFITEIARASLPGADRVAVLFVVGHPETAESFAIAIRNRGSGHLIRVVTIDDLERLAALCEQGGVSHHAATALLAPIASIEAGTLVEAFSRLHSRTEG